MIYNFTVVAFFSENAWVAGTTTYNQVSQGDTPDDALKSLVILLHADAQLSKERGEVPFTIDHKGKNPLPVFTLQGNERSMWGAHYIHDGYDTYDIDPKGSRIKVEVKIDTDDPGYRFAKRYKNAVERYRAPEPTVLTEDFPLGAIPLADAGPGEETCCLELDGSVRRTAHYQQKDRYIVPWLPPGDAKKRAEALGAEGVQQIHRCVQGDQEAWWGIVEDPHAPHQEWFESALREILATKFWLKPVEGGWHLIEGATLPTLWFDTAFAEARDKEDLRRLLLAKRWPVKI